jgi:hypothetical protein
VIELQQATTHQADCCFAARATTSPRLLLRVLADLNRKSGLPSCSDRRVRSFVEAEVMIGLVAVAGGPTAQPQDRFRVRVARAPWSLGDAASMVTYLPIGLTVGVVGRRADRERCPADCWGRVRARDDQSVSMVCWTKCQEKRTNVDHSARAGGEQEC